MKTSTHKERVQRMRMKGFTYYEINQSLGTSYPKSTMSGWCKGIELPEKSKQRLAGLKQDRLSSSRARALIANKLILEKRQTDIRNRALSVVRDVGSNIEALKLALAMLHWGEGSKSKSYRGLSMGNSDPRLLATYMTLLVRCYGLDRNKFKARILCRADQNQGELVKYWSKQLGIREHNFYKTYVDKRTISKTTSKDYMGVCVVSSAGTDIQLELEQIASSFLD